MIQASDELKRSTLDFRRFLALDEAATIEMTAFGGRQKIQVAYVRSVADQLRLLAAAEQQPELKGTYTIFNLIHEGLYARIGENRWIQGAQRASDQEVNELRAVYIDFDAARPRDISSTDSEKAAAWAVAHDCRDFLTEHLKNDTCLGHGDSGNGYSLFIALEPVAPSKETTAKIQRFLKAMAQKFNQPGVKIDVSVCNPARLCPAFGTLKRKGVDCRERPHRMSSFRCSETVTRISLEALG
jgi:hypothetical protein